MTAGDIRKALKNKFNDFRQYAIAEEVGLSTGISHRRLDMIVVNCYESNSFRIDGFEIKVSTSDLRRELEYPEKHGAFFELIDYYTLAAPAGVVSPLLDIIPKKWGILIVNEDGSTRYKRKPLALDDRKNDVDVPRGFLASIVRAIQWHQPSAQELREEYNRGVKDGKEAAERHRGYMADRVQREAAKLADYDKLMARLHIWRDDNIDEILDEFAAFRAMNIDWMKSDIEGTIKQLNKMLNTLNGRD